MKTVRPACFAIMALVGMWASSASGAVLSDDFNDGSIDPSRWDVGVEGSGPTLAETNGHLEFVLPVDSQDGDAGGFGAGLTSVCLLRGDFDMQVDYQLLQWPPANGARVGLGVTVLSGGFAVVERINNGVGGDQYVLHSGGVLHGVPTGDLAGTLRLVRNGSTMSAYYLSGGDWVLLGASSEGTGDVRFWLSVWSHESIFGTQEVRVALDDFEITAGELVQCCGNGIVEPGEQCDDGNLVDGDCCSSTCSFEPAGDPCPIDGDACTEGLCGGVGVCEHVQVSECRNDDGCCPGTCAYAQDSDCRPVPAVSVVGYLFLAIFLTAAMRSTFRRRLALRF